MTEKNICVIGLGLLGGAIAARLCEQGWRVDGFDVEPERCEAAQSHGVKIAASAAAAATSANCILLSLPNSAVVSNLLDELRPFLTPGQVILDTTTGDPEFAATQAAELRACGVAYLEANVIGSSEQARAGDITLLIAGDAAAISGCQELFTALATRRFVVGVSGAAARMKLVVNLVLGLNRAALAEGLNLAETMALPPELALAVLQGSAAYSRAMDVKGQKMLDREYTPQARLAQHLKDVQLMLAAAAQTGASLPLTSAHQRLLEDSVQAGRGALDNSAIIEIYRDRAR